MSTYFNDKLLTPTDEMVISALGETKYLLDSVISFIASEFDDCHTEWKYYGSKIGWSLKLFNKKRNVVFVGIEEGYFRLAFAFGEKAFQEIMKSNLPDSIKQQLSEAKVYVEGRPLRLDIKNKTDSTPLFQLIKIKLNT
ncbi:MAG: DUF3788 domain-containing protein [Paludibacter sp.]|nr:DUF3788 domain-containing protein [Paludibacter sp.]